MYWEELLSRSFVLNMQCVEYAQWVPLEPPQRSKTWPEYCATPNGQLFMDFKKEPEGWHFLIIPRSRAITVCHWWSFFHLKKERYSPPHVFISCTRHSLVLLLHLLHSLTLKTQKLRERKAATFEFPIQEAWPYMASRGVVTLVYDYTDDEWFFRESM